MTPPVQLPRPPVRQSEDVIALQSALSRNGVDADVARRAMAAYRKSIALPTMVAFPVN